MIEIFSVFKYLFASIFLFAGLMHFIKPKPFMNIMPSWVPWHKPMVYLSGFFEITFGILLLIPTFTSWAAWGIILLLIVVFPANVQMVMDAEKYSFIPKWLLWFRLPLQFLLIAWAYTYT